MIVTYAMYCVPTFPSYIYILHVDCLFYLNIEIRNMGFFLLDSIALPFESLGKFWIMGIFLLQKLVVMEVETT